MKVAIITRNSNPWVHFLISRFTPNGIQVVVFDEIKDLGKAPWKSMRFIRRRGIAAYADLFLQQFTAQLARLKHMITGDKGAQAQFTNSQPFDLRKPFEFRATLASLANNALNRDDLTQWFRVSNINSKETIKAIQEAAADHIILCGAPLIKTGRYAEIGPLINAHCGISPKYKGSSPMQWACYNEDWDNIGFTLHIATTEVDGGPIILVERHRPQFDWTLSDMDWFLVYSMYYKLSELILSNSLKTLVLTASPQPQGVEAFPPMGLIRNHIASRRLRRFLSSRSAV